MKVGGRHLLVVVAMCCLSAATVGLLGNIAGLYFTPMAEEFGVMRGSASITVTISSVCVALSGLFSRRLTKLVPLRALILASAVIMAGATLAMGLAPSMAAEYALSAVRGLAGGAIGFVFIAYVLNKWFVTKLGLVTSIAMGCSGIAGAVATPLIQAMVDACGWRSGLMLNAALQALMCLPAVFLVPSVKPQEVGILPLGLTEMRESVSAHHDTSKPVRVDRLTFAGVVCYGVLAAGITSMPQHFPGYVAEMGLSAATGAAMISACLIANTAGKIAMGWLIDRIGALRSVLAYSAVVMTALVAILLLRIPGVLVVAAFFFGLSYGRGTVGLTMMCRELFGNRGFGIVYPVASMGVSMSYAVLSAALGYAYDFTGSYVPALVVLIAMLVGSVALTLWCYRRAVMARATQSDGRRRAPCDAHPPREPRAPRIYSLSTTWMPGSTSLAKAAPSLAEPATVP